MAGPLAERAKADLPDRHEVDVTFRDSTGPTR